MDLMIIPQGTPVLISKAGDYHNGMVGVVFSDGQHSASEVRVGDCTHTFHNSELRTPPEPDVIPEPVEI